MRLRVLEQPDPVLSRGPDLAQGDGEIDGSGRVDRVTGREAARRAPGRDGQIQLAGYRPQERFETLLLNRLAQHERVVRLQEHCKIPRRNVQVPTV